MSINAADFWANTQNIHHYNYTNGFKLYVNGVNGEEIKTPLNAICSQAGYTLADTYQPQIGLNNCESKIQFDSTLAAAYPELPNPLSYSEFELDFSNLHRVYSFLEDKNHHSILIYDNPVTPDTDLKIAKCMSKKKVLEIVTDESMNIIVDEDGYVVISEV